MEENFSHRVSRRNHGETHWRSEAGADDHRHRRHHCYGGHDDQLEEVRFSGKKCRSWTAVVIADCVALCCCPCAVVSLLTLAFVKLPCMIGRRCLGGGGGGGGGGGFGRKRKRRLHRNRGNRRFETAEKYCGGDDHRFVVEKDGSLRKEAEKEEEEEKKTTSLGAEDEARISARVEAERVWLELYQIGHLGFGRVSFTGIH